MPQVLSELNTAASIAGTAGFRLPHGVTPSSPADGDVWTTTTGIYARINGVTVGPSLDQTAADARYLQLTGGTLTGDLALTGAAGAVRKISLTAGGVARWGISKDGATESGSNSGSNFSLERYADGGTYLGSGLMITRQTAATQFYGKVTAPAGTSTDASIRLPHGSSPASLFDGDVWTTTAGMYARINGVTVGPLISATDTAITNMVLKAGDTMTGTLTVQPPSGTATIAVNSVASSVAMAVISAGSGAQSQVRFNTGTTASGGSRWIWVKDGISETGGATGTGASDLQLNYNDNSGTFVGTALKCTRSDGLVTVKADPTAALGIATKQYVDLTSQGFSFKQAVRLVATTNQTLTGAATIDGFAVVTNDRVLCIGQTTTSQNGIYLANTAGAWTRSLDMDASGELADGTLVPVGAGTAGADSQYMCTAVGATPWVPGSSSSTWTRYSSLTDLIAGAGLTKTGNTLDVVSATADLTVAADSVTIVSAPKWTTGRTVTLTGAVTGTSVAFDGSANLSFVTANAPGVIVDADVNASAAIQQSKIATLTTDLAARLLKAGDTMGGLLTTFTPTTGTAGIRLPHGVAPSAPVNGDVWTTTAGIYARINGVTIGPSLDQTAADLRYLQLTGGTVSGAVGINSAINVIAPLNFQTASVNRWIIGKTSDVESGGNQGAHFGIARCDDAGGVIDIPVIIDRNSARATFFSGVTVGASVAAGVGLTVPHGATPTSPNNGDIWTTTAGIYIRINGATVGPVSDTAYIDNHPWKFNTGAVNWDTADMNNLVDIGIYEVDSAAPNVPPGMAAANNSGHVLVMRQRTGASGTWRTQLWQTEDSTGEIWVRGCAGGTWGSWRKCLTDTGDQTISGALTTADDIESGSSFIARGDVYGEAEYIWKQGGVQRWSFTRTAATDLEIQRYDTSGGFLGSVISINASNSSTVFSADVDIHGKLFTHSSDIGTAYVNMPHGTSPTSPSNGDIWTTSAGGLQTRINGVTYPQAGVVVGGTKPTSPPVGTIWVPSG